MDKYDIAYVGGGYVGLTGAVHFAQAGWKTVIVDTSKDVVDGINSGDLRSRGRDFLSYLGTDVQTQVENGYLSSVTDYNEIIKECKTFIISVPTEKDGHPYMNIAEGMCARIVSLCSQKPTILVESTVSIGFSEEVVNHCDSCFGKKPDQDYYLAVCPRRDWFADPDKNLENLPRIVGGVTSKSSLRAKEILSLVSTEIMLTDADTAEITKSLENALLHVPVVFAHQLAQVLPHRDVAEALRLAGTHWRLPEYYLGLGVGGRCVPLGTKYLADISDKLSVADEVISAEEGFRFSVLNALLASISKKRKDARVLIMGLGYRPDFRDIGLSPGLWLAEKLRESEIDVYVHDSVYDQKEIEKVFKFKYSDLTVEMDYIVLSTPHSEYLELPLQEDRFRRGQIILDAHGSWVPYKDVFENRGLIYSQVGGRNWCDL